ncbi:hypothetical protein KIL84_014344 [Mauremys mutica]|uniref:Uncharacterized protein n=1 Tax=Mauremys mutica TaxID=74926 RepID=A0A9D3XQV9_9SAUR|nr:hypothetical protein KIL84_014344 [Mauremys mutica]
MPRLEPGRFSGSAYFCGVAISLSPSCWHTAMFDIRTCVTLASETLKHSFISLLHKHPAPRFAKWTETPAALHGSLQHLPSGTNLTECRGRTCDSISNMAAAQ